MIRKCLIRVNNKGIRMTLLKGLCRLSSVKQVNVFWEHFRNDLVETLIFKETSPKHGLKSFLEIVCAKLHNFFEQ